MVWLLSKFVLPLLIMGSLIGPAHRVAFAEGDVPLDELAGAPAEGARTPWSPIDQINAFRVPARVQPALENSALAQSSAGQVEIVEREWILSTAD